MTKRDFDRWLPEAEAVGRTDNPLNVPYDVALREAGLVADFVDRYWEPAGGRPGLKSARARLTKHTAGAIRSLVRATQHAQTELLLLTDPAAAALGERARQVRDELEAALEYALDDGVHDVADEQLAQIKEFHSQDGERSLELAQALRDYGALAAELTDRLLEADEDFDVGLIDEARELAGRLTDDARPEAVAARRAEIKAAQRARNQLLHLLCKRVGDVRRVAAYVFRAQPEIVREVTSAYERRRRAEARRDKRQAGRAKA